MPASPEGRAEALATAAHTGQVDKAGRPVRDHLRRVVERLEGERERTVAWLHDVLEDTEVREQELREARAFPDDWIDDVVALTRTPAETYRDYIDRIAAHQRENPDSAAGAVKLSDIDDHLATRQHIPDSLVRRYEAAGERLMDALTPPLQGEDTAPGIER